MRGFFFQAEDGIRDFHVTGVQTCALPICSSGSSHGAREKGAGVVKLSHFLRDRAAYIAAYLIFGFVVVAVVQLDLAISGASLRYVNVAYLLLLGLVGLFLFLLYEYRRSRGFCRSLEEAAAADDLDALGALEKPASLEQRLVYDAWQRLNARLQSELAKERERGAKRVAMISQWAHHMKTPVSMIHLELDKAANLAGELGSRAPGPEL